FREVWEEMEMELEEKAETNPAPKKKTGDRVAATPAPRKREAEKRLLRPALPPPPPPPSKKAPKVILQRHTTTITMTAVRLTSAVTPKQQARTSAHVKWTQVVAPKKGKEKEWTLVSKKKTTTKGAITPQRDGPLATAAYPEDRRLVL